jgi:hypothetical protein
MRRRLKKANITFVSLVDAGANRLPVIYKAEGSTIELQTLSKMVEEGEITAVVYAPELRDSQGDIADAAVIKDAAYGFMAKGAAMDIMHDGKKLSAADAFVAQTFLVQKGDPRFVGWKTTDGNEVDLTGAWATVIKVENPELRKLYREGKWNGVSMGGTAVVEAEKSDSSIDRFVEAFLGKLENQRKEDPEMTPQELEAALTKSNAPVLAALTGLAEALKGKLTPTDGDPKPVEKAKAKRPVYTGKPDDDVALAKHQRAVEVWQVQSEADLDTTEGITAYRAALSDLKKRHAEEDAELKKSRQSNQSPEDGEADDGAQGPVAFLQKKDRDLLMAGAKHGRQLAGKPEPK